VPQWSQYLFATGCRIVVAGFNVQFEDHVSHSVIADIGFKLMPALDQFNQISQKEFGWVYCNVELNNFQNFEPAP